MALLPPISPKNKKRVNNEVARCVKIAKEQFGVDIKPKVVYSHPDVEQRDAGMAIYKGSIIVYNPWFLENEPDNFLARTVPHEVAHLVVRAMQEKNKASWKIDPHGPVFRKVMSVFGVKPENRSKKHEYDILVLPLYRKCEIYQCVKCGHRHVLREHQHIRMIETPGRYKCVKCTNDIKLVERQKK